MSIVIAEDLWWPLPSWLQDCHEVQYDATLGDDEERLLELSRDAEALVVRNRTQITAGLLRQLPKLRVLGRLGVGLDNIDLAACRRQNVTVLAARGCNANTVAEYVIAALFEHARFLRGCDVSTRLGRWDRGACMGTELSGKTLGLIGMGDIGRRVALRARALGLRVLACDPLLERYDMLVQDHGITPSDLEALCKLSDYISLHVPLTRETRHLLSTREFGWMKENAVIVNAARGGIIDEIALGASLRDHPGRLAILDVRETEPPAVDDPLRTLPNVLLTPHVAGITHESVQRVAEFILNEVHRALCGQPVQGRVV